MSDVDNIKEEKKTELDDNQKSSLAKRGFGGILVGAAILLTVFLLNPFGNSKVSKEQAPQKEEQTFVEQKNFTQQTEHSPFAFQAETSTSTNNAFGSNDENYTPSTIVKGLSGGALTTRGSSASSSQQQASSLSPAAQAGVERAAELRQTAQNLQNQLNSIVAGASSSGDSTNSFENEAVTNTAITVTAKKSTLDPNLSLKKGTFIPCVLQTAIISSIAGNIACIITNDVYSKAGTVLLVEKGSVVQGYFRSGMLQPGMNRLFVIWEDIETPKQIVINLNAPATDALGGSGIEGWVDNHYMQRFGAAILLSMIDDAFSAAFNNKDGRDYTMNTRENTIEMANTVLENTINIPPTLYKNHGDIVGIYVNKDIDFSKVYRLVKAETRIPKW
jgi:type IV secretion system protein VirB10